MSNSRLELYTPRLALRDLMLADWRTIYALSQEPQVTCYQAWLRLANEEEAYQWVQSAIDHNQRVPRAAYNLAIVTQHNANVIGWLGWGHPSDPTKGDYDFGYALLPRAWGNGYMTEALQAAVTFMFESLGARQIFGVCAQSNQSSARVMQKAGLQLVEQWYDHDRETGADEQYSRYAKDNHQ